MTVHLHSVRRYDTSFIGIIRRYVYNNAYLVQRFHRHGCPIACVFHRACAIIYLGACGP